MEKNHLSQMLNNNDIKNEDYIAKQRKQKRLARLEEIKSLAHDCNFTTAEKLLDNILTLYPDFIKFVEPIRNIRMISKEIYEAKTFDEAQILAHNHRVGDFTDWRLATFDELLLICKLHKVFPELIPSNSFFWSSTPAEGSKMQVVDFLVCGGAEKQEKSFNNSVLFVR